MKISIKFIIPVVLLFFGIPSFSQSSVSFPDVDLNGSDGLLFTAEVTRGTETWKNLYNTTISQNPNANQASSNDVALLNCYPQKLDSLQGGKFLQVRNADGTFMYSSDNKTLTQLSQNSIFIPSPTIDARARDNVIETSVSADGNWMCYFKKRSAATAYLMLSNTQTGQEIVLNDKADFSFDEIPVHWSGNSKVVVYEKQGNLYFLDVENIAELARLEEQYRRIGEGSIDSIAWASDKQLIYIQDDIVFSLSVNELYTRALYSDVLGTGEIVGRLPWDFNGSTDRFWVDESGTQLIIMQNEHSLFYFQIEEPYAALAKSDTSVFSDVLFSQAFVPISDSKLNFSVLWIPSEQKAEAGSNSVLLSTPLLWFEYSGKLNESYVYKLSANNTASQVFFEQLDIPANAANPSLSPDKKLVAFTATKSDESGKIDAQNNRYLYVYDLLSWTQKYVLIEENVVSFEWRNSSSMFIGGSQTVRQWNLITKEYEVLFLSAINRFAWDESGKRILASNNIGTFEYVSKTNTWIPSALTINREHSQMNSLWRIVSSERSGSRYENILFVRALQGESQNKPLFSSLLTENTKRPTVSFALDALDNRDGLVHILDTLSEYGLVGSFFVNGEFLKRFPESVIAIVEKGHEVAPMFYTTVDLESSDFIIDESYIRRGLANNEDEFFALTEKDMELFWHTPYYRSSELIETAGTNAGYTLIDNVLYIDDTLTLETAAQTGFSYVSTTELIEGVASKLYDGAIIPISVGVSDGRRPDYMYEKIDILINAIYEAGFAIVPVSRIVY